LVEQDLHRRRERTALAGDRRVGHPREREQMRPLVRVEEQRPRDRVEHLRGRIDVPALLEPRVPGDADTGELRDLLAAKARRAPTAGRAETDLVGRDALAAAAEEGRQLAPPDLVRGTDAHRSHAGHDPSIPGPGRVRRVSVIPG
jgi:hypothetical protein